MRKTAEEANIRKRFVDTEQDVLVYQACGEKYLLILWWYSEGIDHML